MIKRNQKDINAHDVKRIPHLNPEEIAIIFNDPLIDTTRRERKSLLITSLICLVISNVGVLPTKVTWLGIEFNEIDKNYIYIISLGILSYLISTFSLYAETDFKKWFTSYIYKTSEIYEANFYSKGQEIPPEYRRQNWRVLFDALIPIIIGYIAGSILFEKIYWISEYLKLILVIPVYFSYRLLVRTFYIIF